MNHNDQENCAPAEYLNHQPDYTPRLSSRPPLMPMIPRSELTMFKFGNLSLQNSIEVTIVFDCGRLSMSASRYKLSIASPLFSHALQDPQLSTIRLRDDFAFAIPCMLDFVHMGHYLPDPEMHARYPLVTLLDLHIHVYVTADKYSLSALADYAVAEFLTIAIQTMHSDFVTDNPDTYTRSFDRETGSRDRYAIYEDHTAHPRSEPYAGLHDLGDHSPVAQIDRLLNAICLLYRFTAPGDAMRAQVIELLKTGLGKLMQLRFFGKMLQNLDLGIELLRSLEGDGFSVRVVPLTWVGGRALGVRFETV